jgi:hypothetical protein
MAVVDKGIIGKHKMTVSLEYEIKDSGKPLSYDVNMPKKEMRQSMRDIKRLCRALTIMAKHGWDVQEIEAGVED